MAKMLKSHLKKTYDFLKIPHNDIRVQINEFFEIDKNLTLYSNDVSTVQRLFYVQTVE